MTAAKQPLSGHNTADFFFSVERDYLTKEETFVEFAQRSYRKRDLLRDLLDDLGEKYIIGYGAPAKGNTLLNFLGELPIEYLIDTTPAKQGLYTPGTHLKVYSPDKLKIKRDLPEYALLLAWNYADVILKQEADLRAAGTKFIIPFPEVTIV